MTVSETYLVLFAALETADTLLFGWIIVSILCCAAVLLQPDRLTRSTSNYLFTLYLLFVVMILGRFGIVLSKILDLSDLLRTQGESLPAPQFSMMIGLATIVLLFLGSGVTLRLILTKRSRVRVI